MADFTTTTWNSDVNDDVYREHFDVRSYVLLADLVAISGELVNSRTVRVYFGRPLQAWPTSSDVSRYSITGPSSITVVAAAVAPGTPYVTLTVSGVFIPGWYTVTVAEDTVVNVGFMGNVETEAEFRSDQLALTLVAQRRSSTTVRVDFSAPLGARTETSDASRYSITGPSAISVDSVTFTPGDAFVTLTVSGTWLNGTYELAVDAGTAETSHDEELVNDEAEVDFVVDSPDCPECPECPDPECPECPDCDCGPTAPPDGEPWFRINGIELSGIVAVDGEPDGPRRDVGAVHDASDGSLTVTRQSRKRDFNFKTVPLPGRAAHAWAGLLTGEGMVWSFDAHFYSSKGVGGAGSVVDVEVQALVKKYGAGALKVVGGESWQSDSIREFVEGAWTISVWHRIGAGAFVHEVRRSDGALWVDGARNDSYSVDGMFTMDDDQLFTENSSSTHYYDDLVFCPYLWPSDWPAQMFAAGQPFGPTPFLSCAGLLVPEVDVRRMLCQRCDERVQVAALDGLHRDLRVLEVELRGA